MTKTAGAIRPGSIRMTSLIPAYPASSARRSELMSWIDQRPDDAMDGAFTAVGPEVVRTVDPAAFRDAMSRLGAAVHVITTAGPGGKAGATATGVCSGSDAPRQLLLWR